MNLKPDFLKPNERIIYLILIVALVIALITISTCNKRTLDENFFVKSQVEALNGDMKELEGKLDDKDSSIRVKAKEIIEKKNEIQDLIKKGQITASEAQQRIKELRAQLNDVNGQLLSQKNLTTTNSDSLGRIINGLRGENGSLQKQVVNLQEALAKKPVADKVEIKPEEEIPATIQFLPETKLSPKNGIYLGCKLYQEFATDQNFQVFIYDEDGTLISPQSGIFSFTISKGQREFHSSSAAYKKGSFKVGKKYSIAIRNSKGIEISRNPYRVPFL